MPGELTLRPQCGPPRPMRWAAIGAVVVMSACDATLAHEDVGTDANYAAGCHWDCFFGVYCEDGVVWQQQHAPVPCSAWTGSCPRDARHTCLRGCSDRPPRAEWDGDEPTWSRWCEETEERRLYDPCTVDLDCQPPQPIAGERQYLACDPVRGCVPIPAPRASTQPCSADLRSFYSPTRGSAYGALEDPECDFGWCRFSARASAEGCDRHLCALPCEDDWDCPPTHTCGSVGVRTGGVDVPATGVVQLCVRRDDLICHGGP